MTWVGCQLQSILHPGGGALHGNITLHITDCSDTTLVTCTPLRTNTLLSTLYSFIRKWKAKTLKVGIFKLLRIFQFICDDPLDIYLYWWPHDYVHEIWRFVPGTHLWLVLSRPQGFGLKLLIENCCDIMSCYQWGVPWLLPEQDQGQGPGQESSQPLRGRRWRQNQNWGRCLELFHNNLERDNHHTRSQPGGGQGWSHQCWEPEWSQTWQHPQYCPARGRSSLRSGPGLRQPVWEEQSFDRRFIFKCKMYYVVTACLTTHVCRPNDHELAQCFTMRIFIGLCLIMSC